MAKVNDEELLATGDYVRDPLFGVVPKDPETQVRLRKEKLLAEAAAVAPEQPAQVTETQVAGSGNVRAPRAPQPPQETPAV